MKPKVLIGSAHLHRPARYEHRDPAPHLPFYNDDKPHIAESVFYGALSVILTVAMLGVAYLVTL